MCSCAVGCICDHCLAAEWEDTLSGIESSSDGWSEEDVRDVDGQDLMGVLSEAERKAVQAEAEAEFLEREEEEAELIEREEASYDGDGDLGERSGDGVGNGTKGGRGKWAAWLRGGAYTGAGN